MTTALDRPPLENALGIPGARSVSLLDPDGPAVLWWAGDAPPGADQAAAVVAMAEAAAGLVLSSGSGDELSDIILTSNDTFHVVRLVEDDVIRVAHLTLHRSGANLAMARREFRQLIEDYYRNIPLPRRDRADPPAVKSGDGPTTGPIGPADLVIRTADLVVGTAELVIDEAEASARPPLPATLADLLREPYSADEDVLDRILATLRRL
jgi:hypothetical protein